VIKRAIEERVNHRSLFRFWQPDATERSRAAHARADSTGARGAAFRFPASVKNDALVRANKKVEIAVAAEQDSEQDKRKGRSLANMNKEFGKWQVGHPIRAVPQFAPCFNARPDAERDSR
jgi:hypothetical protein